MGFADAKCFLSQFHRGISCNETEFGAFENHCAQGMMSSTTINYSQPVEMLPGFSLLVNSLTFLIRLTTALTDFMAFTSNSKLQQQYNASQALWRDVRLKSGMRSDHFATLEEEAFALYAVAASAAQRSVPSDLDRGLTILKTLPLPVRSGIDKLSRKKSVPENMMHREWVIAQVKRIELEDDPKYSWANLTSTGQRIDRPCYRFAAGTCTSGNACRFEHNTPTNTPIASLVTGSTATETRDCYLQISPDCETSFKVDPDYWASLKTADGKSFSVPKSCKPCRQLKKTQYVATGASLFTAADAADDEQHDNDGCDDDYMLQFSMTMSDVPV